MRDTSPRLIFYDCLCVLMRILVHSPAFTCTCAYVCAHRNNKETKRIELNIYLHFRVTLTRALWQSQPNILPPLLVKSNLLSYAWEKIEIYVCL
jgi:hypothetical protein